MKNPPRTLASYRLPPAGEPPYGPPPPPSAADRLVALFYQIGQLEQALPTTPLQPGEEQTLGGVLFPDGPGLVMGVGNGLRDYAEVLAPVMAATGEDGHSLLAGQHEASLWSVLEARLAALTRLVRQTQIKLQAGLIVRAMRVLKYVKATEALPGVQPMTEKDAFVRRLALIGAFAIVDRYYNSLQEKRASRREARAAANPVPKVEPSARSLKAQERARRIEQEQGAARLRREFQAFINERGRAFDPPPGAGAPPGSGSPPGSESPRSAGTVTAPADNAPPVSAAVVVHAAGTVGAAVAAEEAAVAAEEAAVAAEEAAVAAEEIAVTAPADNAPPASAAVVAAPAAGTVGAAVPAEGEANGEDRRADAGTGTLRRLIRRLLIRLLGP